MFVAATCGAGAHGAIVAGASADEVALADEATLVAARTTGVDLVGDGETGEATTDALIKGTEEAHKVAATTAHAMPVVK